MSIQSIIETRLTAEINIQYLEVTNESHQHNVPPGSESHFKVVLVSEDFSDKSLVARHRMVNKVLHEELQNSIHALALHTCTPTEWQEKNATTPVSPPCLDGGKQNSG